MKYNQPSNKTTNKKEPTTPYCFRLNRPTVRHDADNRPSACQLYQLLVPVQQHTHLLATTALTEVTGLDLRETGGLRRDGLARGLGSTAGAGRGHSLVTGSC